MNDADLLALLPAWVRDDVPDSDEQALQRAADDNPQLAQLANALRDTQMRAAEVLSLPMPDRAAPRPQEARADAPAVNIDPSAAPAKSGRGPLFVAIAAGVGALTLGVLVIVGLLAGPAPSVPPPVTEPFALVMNGSLAPLARSHPEDASRSLMALGVPEESAVPPDLSPLGWAFSSATALPGRVPGAAFEYVQADQRILVQSARILTVPPDAQMRAVGDLPVYWTQLDGHPVALWHDGDLHRAVTGTVSQEALQQIVTGWMASSTP